MARSVEVIKSKKGKPVEYLVNIKKAQKAGYGELLELLENIAFMENLDKKNNKLTVAVPEAKTKKLRAK